MTEREQWERWMAQARQRAMHGSLEQEGVLTHRKINGQAALLYYSDIFEDYYLMDAQHQEFMAVGRTVDDIFAKIGERPNMLSAFLSA